MDVRFSPDSPETVDADALAVFAGSDWKDDLEPMDVVMDGRLIPWLESQGFDGKSSAAQTTATIGVIEAPLLIVVPAGDKSAVALQKASAVAAREARKHRVRTLAIDTGLGADGVRTVLENAWAGNYEFDRYIAEKDRKPGLETLIFTDAEDDGLAAGVASRSSVRARWQSWARDLVNGPPADVYPESLAAAAVEKLGALDHVRVEVWDFEKCRAEGLVGLVAVGQGSARPGCLIHVTYRPPNAAAHIAFVGKGVTFDSGGLSLKPSAGMQTMRCDMGGAAVVLGATGALAELGSDVAIDCFVGAVENMNDGNSYKLGDILQYRNGVSVEVHNTDAEGRLVLADCLINACAVEGVTHVVDAATLTGACVVAIGADFTGLFTADDGFAHDLGEASKDDGEGLWRLPLHAPYKAKLRGDWSTIKNVGGRAAGASTAALYLQHFVTDDVKWAHLDVAGSSWRDKADSRWAAGATGSMVRSLTTWARRLTR